ncbi:hypothetical protein Vretifemale_16019 [Volvox reticuliferus]|uniref:CASTOR/POLLUX/SYM8 ion channel conserved domain-containing protein n=2 Tax=Volvox reticuliferus TaxID=1737510 RepID=A0A8J4CUN5_9CHLO|nr:hypothetical protein Vretifemale_16019 [Volvox reticuliferus]
MELPRFAAWQITRRKPLQKEIFPYFIKTSCLFRGRGHFPGVMAATPAGRSSSSSNNNNIGISGSGSASNVKGRSGKSSSKGPGRRRNSKSGEHEKPGVVELPEVLYRFTDSRGNSAIVIDQDGTVSRISIVESLPLAAAAANPLSSFEERDIDPSSSDPVVPTSILAPLPLPLPVPPLPPAAFRSVDGGTSGSGGSSSSSSSTGGSSAGSGASYGNGTSMIISTSGSGGAAVFTYVTRSHDPVTGAAIPTAGAAPAGTALAVAGAVGNGVAVSGSSTGGSGSAATAAAITAAAAAAAPGPLANLAAISRVIKVEREMPNIVMKALLRVLSWRPYEFFRWLSRQGRRTHGSGSGLPLMALPGSVGGADVDARAAEVHTDVSAFDSAATDVEFSSSTDGSDAETTSADGGDVDLLWDPTFLGALTLAAAAASVAVLMAMSSASATAAAAAVAAAAALTAPPSPSSVNWVQLNPVPGMAPEAATAVHWPLLTWRELCNQILEPLSRAFQKWSYAALPVKIAFVLISSLPLVMVFGTLYYVAVGGRGAGQSFMEALIKIHCILNRMPGTNMVRENNAVSFLVVNAAFFTGLFTFAIFLGIVSDEVKNTFRLIKTGDYPVRVRDHVLVLNWSHHTIPLLRQYDLARRYAGNDTFFRRPVVLLSDNPKQDMDNEIAERLKSNSLDVITRSGSPAMLRDLTTVAAASAHTIIVLHPGGAASHASAEAAKASTAMALAALTAPEAAARDALPLARDGGYNGGADSIFGGIASAATRAQVQSALGLAPKPTHGSMGRRLPRVLFQMPDEVLVAQDPVTSFTKSSPANIRGNMQALSITDASVIDRFTCQAAVQPGMLRIWASVLQHGPHSVKALMVPVLPQLVGETFGTARCQYSDAVLIGVMRANGPNGNNGLNGSNNNGSGSGSYTAAVPGSAVAPDVASAGYSLYMDVRELDSWELAVNDMLIMFVPARVAGLPQASSATAALFPPAAAAAAERIKRHGGYNAPPKKVIMAGYQWQDVSDVAAAFSDSAPDGSHVTFILPAFPSPEEGDPELPGSSGSCRIRYVDTKGPMLSLRALQEAGIKTADAVVLRPPIQDMERWCAKKPVTARVREADAMVMAGLIQVQDAVIASGRTDPPHVVARLNRYGSTETALRYFEMLSPPLPQPPPQPPQQQQQLDMKQQQQQQVQQQQNNQQQPSISQQPQQPPKTSSNSKDSAQQTKQQQVQPTKLSQPLGNDLQGQEQEHPDRHSHPPWWRARLLFAGRTAAVGLGAKAPGAADLEDSPISALLSRKDAYNYVIDRQWPLRWRMFQRHSQRHGGWASLSASPSSSSSSTFWAGGRGENLAGAKQLQPQQLQLPPNQLQRIDSTTPPKEQQQPSQATIASAAVGVDGGTIGAMAPLPLPLPLPLPPPSARDQPPQGQTSEPGHGHNHGQGSGLGLSRHLPVLLHLPGGGGGGGGGTGGGAPAAASAAPAGHHASPCTALSPTGPLGSTASAATAAAAAEAAGTQSTCGGGGGAGVTVALSPSGIGNGPTAAPAAPSSASTSQQHPQAQPQPSTASAASTALQNHMQSMRHLAEGPLAATQAVMAGNSLPALPIGNEANSGGPLRGPVPGVNGGGGGGATATGLTATASQIVAAVASLGTADGGGAGSSNSSSGATASAPTTVGSHSGAAVTGATAAQGSSSSSSSGNGGGGGGSNNNSNTGGAHTSGNGATASSGSTGSTGSTSGSSNNGSSGSSSSNATGTGGAGTITTASMHDKRPIIRNPEIFLADDLIGALLTQVAAQPNYAQLVSQLITKDGAELYLRSPAVFNIASGERLSFAELSESTRLLRQVALGVVRADGRCCLVPKPHELLDFEPGDQVLVLSDDYRIKRK